MDIQEVHFCCHTCNNEFVKKIKEYELKKCEYKSNRSDEYYFIARCPYCKQFTYIPVTKRTYEKASQILVSE